MLYRDYMQKFRPLMGPDGPAGGEGGEAAAAAPGGTTPAADGLAAATAGEAAAAAAPAAGAGAPAAEAPAAGAAEPAKTESTPSLISEATGKPKPDVEAKPDAEAAKPDPAKDAPAPAAVEKTDAEKAAEAAGEKPKTEAELKAEADAAAATDPAKDATAEAPPPAPIKYEAFKVPDGVTLDQERIGKFVEIAGPGQVNQDVAQNLLNLHVEEIQRVHQQAVDNQRKVWNTYIDTITNELRKDPDLGGNRLETSLSMAKAVIEEYLPAAEAAEYCEMLKHNGMGNHRLQVKLLHAIGDKLNIFEDGLVPANPQAPKAPKSPGNRGWYDKTPGGTPAS
jgi:hypothetical protein